MKLLRTFYASICRFKLASTLNILGLAIAFSVFIIIISQVYWEFSYNKEIKDGDRVYLMTMDVYNDGSYWNNLSRPIGELIGQSSPYVESYTVYSPWGIDLCNIGGERDVKEEFREVSANFIDVFSMTAVEGDLGDMAKPNAAIIPKSIADKYFQDTTAIGGSIIKFNRISTGGSIVKEDVILEIVAVYDDFTENSTVRNAIFSNMGEFHIDNSADWMYSYFYKLTEGANVDSFKKDISEYILENGSMGGEKEVMNFSKSIKFVNLEDLYFETSFYGEMGNLSLTLMLLLVAIVIIVIASINYVNLFMALVPIRIRNVNISKVFGAGNGTLRGNLIFEGVGIALIGVLLSLPIVQMFSDMDICSFTTASLKVDDNIPLVLISVGIAVAVGLFASVLPALYITSFSPSLVLMGSFGRSAKGRVLRLVLTSFQFVVSIVLIVVAIIIMLQNSFMDKYDYGINRDRIVNVRLENFDAEGVDAFTNELLKNPKIEGVSYSDYSIINLQMTWTRENEEGEQINYICLPVCWTYPEFMGMELVEGRLFTEDDSSKPGGTAIFNETAAEKYNFKVGERFNGPNREHQIEIVGIVKDFNFCSLEEEVVPCCLYEGSMAWRAINYANIRIAEGANFAEVSEYIKGVMVAVSPDIKVNLVDIISLNEDIGSLYEKEETMSKVINLFSLISIFISLLGLFGIIVSETQYRRKEVALRKIHGSSIRQILGLFMMQSVRVLLVSAVIAIPIAWYVANEWLSTYAYRIPVYWWVFALAILIVFVIVIGIVVSQTYRAANEDPTRNLKSN